MQTHAHGVHPAGWLRGLARAALVFGLLLCTCARPASAGGERPTLPRFAPGECNTLHLPASTDTYLDPTQASYNFGGGKTLLADTTTANSRRTALLRWDVSSIPVGAEITAASLSLTVTNASDRTFYLYALRRDWVEGNSTGAAGSGASWSYSLAGSSPWATPGAGNTETDRYNANLWNADGGTFASTGGKQIDLNAEGMAVVQGWLDGGLTNNGVIIQNYSGSISNQLIFSSSEADSAAARPALNVSYCEPAGPVITLTGELSPFNGQPGQPGAAQSYSVAGEHLGAELVITAPDGFELSSGGAYAAALALTPAGGTVAPTTIFVRLNAPAPGSYGGEITHTSAGAAPVGLAVSGTAQFIYTLTVSSSAGGSVALAPPGGSYPAGTVVTLTPQPEPGQVFSGWGGPDADDLVDVGGNSWSLSMDADKTLSAGFAPLALNHPPVISTGESAAVSMSEDGAPTGFSLALNAEDPDAGDALTWGLLTPPANGQASVSGVGSSPAVSYTPAADFAGADSFRVQVTDGRGGQDSIRVEVSVTPVNDAPALTEGEEVAVFMSPDGEPLPFHLTLHAADVDGPALAWSIGAGAGHGLAGVVGAGESAAVSYTPTPGYTGIDSFSVQVNDGSAVDAIQVLVTIAAAPARQEIPLRAGWNLVSFHLTPAGPAVADVLASLAGNYDLVYAWDAGGGHPESGHWLRADTEPLTTDTLLTLDTIRGFWIHLSAADRLEIEGGYSAEAVVPLQAASGGWNLAGYPAAAAGALPAILSEHGAADATRVYSYQPGDASDPWKVYDPDAPPYANDLTELTPGWGYWIQMSAPAVWMLPY